MPVNGMNVGMDYSFGYYDADTGTVVDLGDVQNISISAPKHDIASRPYNGPPKFGYIGDGYKISGTITRTSSVLEDFMLNKMANFNAGSASKAGYLSESVKNPDGTTSRYQYTGFVFWLPDLGDISREKTVTMKFEGMASEKKPIS
jgi:hypothetical protein